MFSWIYPSILSWEKPGIASLTTSVCVTGSKRVGEIYVEFRVDPVIVIYVRPTAKAKLRWRIRFIVKVWRLRVRARLLEES